MRKTGGGPGILIYSKPKLSSVIRSMAAAQEPSMKGDVNVVQVQFILRDFATEKLAEYAKLLQETADTVLIQFPGLVVDVETCVQYRNWNSLTQTPNVLRKMGLYSARHRGSRAKIK